MTVAMLSLYPSPVNSNSRNVEGNFTPKMKYRFCCHFPDLEFM